MGFDSSVVASRAGKADANGYQFSGVFAPFMLTFETGATDPAIGRELTIALASLGSGTGATYDNIRLDAAALTPAAIPEPATWAMMILGLGSVGAVVRRGRRSGFDAACMLI